MNVPNLARRGLTGVGRYHCSVTYSRGGHWSGTPDSSPTRFCVLLEPASWSL